MKRPPTGTLVFFGLAVFHLLLREPVAWWVGVLLLIVLGAYDWMLEITWRDYREMADIARRATRQREAQ